MKYNKKTQTLIRDAVSFLSPQVFVLGFQGHLLTSLHCISQHRFSTDVCKAQEEQRQGQLCLQQSILYTPKKRRHTDTSASPKHAYVRFPQTEKAVNVQQETSRVKPA